MSWKSKRIKKEEERAKAIRVAEELHSKNIDLAHTNRTLSLLRIIDGLVLERKNTIHNLLEGITRALIDNSNYLFGLIFFDGRGSSNFSMELGGASFNNKVWSGSSSEKLKLIRIHVTDEWAIAKDISTLVDLELNYEKVLDQVFTASSTVLNEIINTSGAKSLYIVKIYAQQQLVGLMCIGMDEQSNTVKLEELEQLGRIGEATGIAIDNKLLTEQYKQLLKSLQHSNAKLKALDEAKDEFVSMASHQLRTPLTSIKGYISMVLEGDAGKINDTQRQMLGQALFSSQRMVYLISDLLNVSRLKTGKFIIESKPVYLPDLVESELSQLYEGANAKNIKLMYDKPKQFTTMNLDEMKIRQVVMNFTDNAIYYTPSGGKITVELKDKKDSVEFRVKDTGIGVPRKEQHKLFAKFYRADNARKARPDGTGLGIFMAKKVIVAQGGAIIFDSKEGKGSTFGFSFPKDRLEVKPATAAKN